MKTVLMLLLMSIATSTVSAPAGTQFTYQGRLSFQGTPAAGSFDFEFRLFDTESGGNPVGPMFSLQDESVEGGVFTVELDFGANAFMGEARWLEVEVREGTSNGAYTTLLPRKPVTASPFALDTLFLTPGIVDTTALEDDSVTTSKIANGNVFTDDLANFAVSTGKLSNQAVTRLKIADDSIGTAQIEDSAVTSSDIRDGTIQPTDLANVYLHDKTQIVEVEDSLSVPAGVIRQPVAVCPDVNDIPLTFACGADISAQITLRGINSENWSSNALKAQTGCVFHNEGSSPLTVSASIFCLSVP